MPEVERSPLLETGKRQCAAATRPWRITTPPSWRGIGSVKIEKNSSDEMSASSATPVVSKPRREMPRSNATSAPTRRLASLKMIVVKSSGVMRSLSNARVRARSWKRNDPIVARMRRISSWKMTTDDSAR